MEKEKINQPEYMNLLQTYVSNCTDTDMELILEFKHEITEGKDIKQTTVTKLANIHKFYFKFIKTTFGLPKTRAVCKIIFR